MIFALPKYIVSMTLISAMIFYTFIFFYYGLANKPIWIAYTQTLFNLGVIVAVIGFVLDRVYRMHQQDVDYQHQLTQQQKQGFINIEQEFMHHYPELLPFYKEIHQQNNLLQSLPNPKNIDQIKRAELESIMSNVMIQSVENIYSSLKLVPDYQSLPEFVEWTNTWKQWFKSPTLRRIWKINKSVYFSQNTVNFIDKEIIGKNIKFAL